ncbi:transglutaminase-like cysteine peptidase [Brevundimonas sp. BAL3]|uniref:transglutaminase-like cysteine peptidase n=1 Tax=Brevundimonas sp. BAL3 TaxID=391600 RepID=UPI0012EA51D0|nr:transglutaminase-like cysteine peptidase [Brevundimonas sp. BAL3]
MSNQRSLLHVAALAALTAGASGQAWAADRGPAFGPDAGMRLGAPAMAPSGFLDFCQRSPADCRTSASDTTDPALVARRANSLYWASVFQRPAPAAGPAATRPSPPRSGAYDWSQVFGPAPAQPQSPPRLQNAAAPATHRSETAAARATAAPAVRTTLPGAVDSSLIVAFSRSPVRSLPWARPSQTTAPSVPAGPALAGSSARFNPMARVFASYAIAEGTPPSAETWPQSRPFAERFDRFDRLARPALPRPSLVDPSPEGRPVVTPEIAVLPAPVDRDDQAAATSVDLDRQTWARVNTINRSVNRQIRSASDVAVYGTEDYWQAPAKAGARGDCEDYVLAKRAALIEAGVPAAALSIAIVKTRWGESHAVLLLASTSGEYVLDNLTPWISRWDQVDYEWRERQAPGKVFEWVQVEANRA